MGTQWFLRVPGQISGGPYPESWIVQAIEGGLDEAEVRAEHDDEWAPLASHAAFADALVVRRRRRRQTSGVEWKAVAGAGAVVRRVSR